MNQSIVFWIGKSTFKLQNSCLVIGQPLLCMYGAQMWLDQMRGIEEKCLFGWVAGFVVVVKYGCYTIMYTHEK